MPGSATVLVVVPLLLLAAVTAATSDTASEASDSPSEASDSQSSTPDSQNNEDCPTLLPTATVPSSVRAAAFSPLRKRFWFINSTTLSALTIQTGPPFQWRLVAGSPYEAVVRDSQLALSVRFLALTALVVYEPLELMFLFDGTTLRVAEASSNSFTIATRFGVSNDAQEIDGSRYVARLPWSGFGAYDGSEDALYMSARGSHCVRVWYATQSWSNASAIATLVGTCGTSGNVIAGDPAAAQLDAVSAVALFRSTQDSRNCLIIADRNGLYRLNWLEGDRQSIWQVALPRGHFQPSVPGAHFWSLAATPQLNSPLLFISSTDTDRRCSVFSYTETGTTTTAAVDIESWSVPWSSSTLQCKDLVLLPAAPKRVFIGAGPRILEQSNCRATTVEDQSWSGPPTSGSSANNGQLVGGVVGGVLGFVLVVAGVFGAVQVWRTRRNALAAKSGRSPLSSPRGAATETDQFVDQGFHSPAEFGSSAGSQVLRTLRAADETTFQSSGAFSVPGITASASTNFRILSPPNSDANDITEAPNEPVAGEPGMAVVQRKKALCLSGRFQRLRLIGRGANGSVYSVLLSDGSTAAMKEILLVEDSAREQLADVEREMALMTSIAHPRIVQYYCWTHDLHELKISIFMELVTGGSLSRLARTMEQRISEAVLCRYIFQAVEGMAYIHSKGIVHRDLKGDNLLLTADGEVKITDFATAKIVGAKTRGAQTMIGTPIFMAPEILGAEDYIWGDQEAGGYGAKADVWSLGITVCELGNRGVPPWPSFANPGMAFAYIAGASGQPTIPDCFSPEAKDFVRLCCARSPQQRPTMAELLEHQWFKQCGPSENSGSRTTSEGGEPPQPQGRK